MSYPTVSQKEISSLLTSIESSGKGFLSHSQLEMPNRVTSKEIAEEARKALIDQARSLIAALEKPMGRCSGWLMRRWELAFSMMIENG